MMGKEGVDGLRKRSCGPRTADCGRWADALLLLLVAGVPRVIKAK